MHYTQYWRLHHSPFVASARWKAYEGGTVGEALARAKFMVKNRAGCGLLVGPPLVGKSVLLKQLAAKLRIAPASAGAPPRVIYLSAAGLELDEMLAAVIEQLLPDESSMQAAWRVDRERRWRTLEDATRAVAAEGRGIALLIDDAQSGCDDVFAIIRRLQNRAANLTCLLSLPQERVLDLPRGLAERCQMRIGLPAWDLGQTADYFEFCMDQAKGRDSIFDALSINRIHELAEGLPFRINYLADLALVAGALRRSDRVSAELIEEVVEELAMRRGDDGCDLISFDPSESGAR